MFHHARTLVVAVSCRTVRRLPFRALSTAYDIHGYKRQVLQRALEVEIKDHGWTQEAVVAAAASASFELPGNVSLAAVGLVQDPTQLLYFAMNQWNERLRKDIAERSQTEDLAEFVYQALKSRLGYMGHLVQAKRWHEGMALGARPDNWLETEKHVREIIDIIAGARPRLSTSEQLGLGAVYVAAELHMLADSSMDFADTWTFLRHRVDDWDKLRSAGPLSSDHLYVATTVASSIATGIASLLVSPKAIGDLQQLATLTTATAHSTVQQATGLASQIFTSAVPTSPSVPGSSPNDYKIPSSDHAKF